MSMFFRFEAFAPRQFPPRRRTFAERLAGGGAVGKRATCVSRTGVFSTGAFLFPNLPDAAVRRRGNVRGWPRKRRSRKIRGFPRPKRRNSKSWKAGISGRRERRKRLRDGTPPPGRVSARQFPSAPRPVSPQAHEAGETSSGNGGRRGAAGPRGAGGDLSAAPLVEMPGQDVEPARLQAVSNSNPTMLRSPNSTPIRWIGASRCRYLSA